MDRPLEAGPALSFTFTLGSSAASPQGPATPPTHCVPRAEQMPLEARKGVHLWRKVDWRPGVLASAGDRFGTRGHMAVSWEIDGWHHAPSHTQIPAGKMKTLQGRGEATPSLPSLWVQRYHLVIISFQSHPSDGPGGARTPCLAQSCLPSRVRSKGTPRFQALLGDVPSPVRSPRWHP